jgi:hypothetical protein
MNNCQDFFKPKPKAQSVKRSDTSLTDKFKFIYTMALERPDSLAKVFGNY